MEDHDIDEKSRADAGRAAFLVEGPLHSFLVVTKPDGERIALDVTTVTSVEQQGSQCLIHWCQGENARHCRVNQDVESLVQLLCSAEQTPVVDYNALAQSAFGK